MTADLTVRRATATDAGRIHALMRALAEHEGLAPYLAATPDSLTEALAVQPFKRIEGTRKRAHIGKLIKQRNTP